MLCSPAYSAIRGAHDGKSLDPEHLALKVLDALAGADKTYDAMSGGWRLHLAP